jgi:hypothetical protein
MAAHYDAVVPTCPGKRPICSIRAMVPIDTEFSLTTVVIGRTNSQNYLAVVLFARLSSGDKFITEWDTNHGKRQYDGSIETNQR